jgi:hypothetical protein
MTMIMEFITRGVTLTSLGYNEMASVVTLLTH